MKIAINFKGDNDFHFVWSGILRSILKEHEFDPKYVESLTKDNLFSYINEVAFGTFLFHRNYKEYPPEEIESYRSYLKISYDELLIGSDVPDYEDHNHAMYVLDTDLNYPNNTPIYSM